MRVWVLACRATARRWVVRVKSTSASFDFYMVATFVHFFLVVWLLKFAPSTARFFYPDELSSDSSADKAEPHPASGRSGEAVVRRGHIEQVLDELCAALITLERVNELLSGTTSTSGDGSKPISEAISSVREAIEALKMNDPDEPSPLVRGFVLGEP